MLQLQKEQRGGFGSGPAPQQLTRDAASPFIRQRGRGVALRPSARRRLQPLVSGASIYRPKKSSWELEAAVRDAMLKERVEQLASGSADIIAEGAQAALEWVFKSWGVLDGAFGSAHLETAQAFGMLARFQDQVGPSALWVAPATHARTHARP